MIKMTRLVSFLKLDRQRIDELFIIGIFLMYIPFLQINVETQPLVCMVAALAGLTISFRDRLALPFHATLAAILVVMVAISFFFTLAGGRFALVESVKYLVGPLFFVLMFRELKDYRLEVLALLVYFLFFIAIVTTVNLGPLSTGISAAIGQVIERTAAGGSDGLRGIALLTNEPSYAAGQLIFLLLLLEYYRATHPELAPKRHKTVSRLKLLTLLMMLLTKSALGFLFLLTYFAPILLRKFKFRYLLVIPFATGLVYVVESLKPSRISQVVTAMASVDLNNLLFSLSLLEPSGTTRLFLNIAAFSALLYNPFGYGMGTFQSNWFNQLDLINLQFLTSHEVLGAAYANRLATNASTYLANITHDLGVIPFVILNLLLLWPLRHRSKHTLLRSQIFLALIIMLYFQSQITNPIPWALLVILYHLSDARLEERTPC